MNFSCSWYHMININLTRSIMYLRSHHAVSNQTTIFRYNRDLGKHHALFGNVNHILKFRNCTLPKQKCWSLFGRNFWFSLSNFRLIWCINFSMLRSSISVIIYSIWFNLHNTLYLFYSTLASYLTPYILKL